MANELAAMKLQATSNRQELEELMKQSPPPGREPMLPRVYEYYTDDEGYDEFDYLDEEGNLRRTGGGAGGDEESDEDVLQYLYSKKTRKQRMEEAEAKYAAFRKREEEERLRDIEIQRREDLLFPSKLSFFYTDGYYDRYPPFGVKPELVQEYAEQEAAFREKLQKQRGESFTEKFKRHFWPPSKLFCKDRFFRGRGSYPDFPEVGVIQEIEVNLEHPGVEMLSNQDKIFHPDEELIEAEAEEEEEEEEEEETGATVQKKPKKKVKGTRIMGAIAPITILATKDVGWADFYYDDEEGEFQLKIPGLDVDYYFDSQNSCWRRKRGKKKSDDQTTPYDFYYDNGEFYPRETYEGKHVLDISFDERLGIWRYSPKESTRLLIQRGEIRGVKSVKRIKGDTIEDVTTKKSAKAVRKGTEAPLVETTAAMPQIAGPDEFYFDEYDTFWKRKTDGNNVLEYDTNGRRWIIRFENGDWRGLTGYSPDDFYWADDLGKYQLKSKHQPDLYDYNFNDGVWHLAKPSKKPNRTGISPTDYYFEDGMFKLKEPLRDNLYKRLRYALIFKRRDVPRSGLYPEDFYYDYPKKLWLPRSVRMALLKAKDEDLPWTKKDAIVDKKAKLLTADDFWFDIEEGVFIKKDSGLIGLDTYYFDQQESVWKSNEQKALSNRLRLLPGDFYFNGTEFKRKNKNEFENFYVYDQKTGVYWGKDVKNRGKGPLKFYFDFRMETWRVRTSDAELKKDAAGRYVKIDKDKQSPLDFYWDDSMGRFLNKDPTEEESYYFAQEDGVFKLIGPKPGANGPGLTPRNFYFDENDNRWRLKVSGHDRNYFWDKNNHIFRYSLSVETRSGLKASDYYFNAFLGQWMAIANVEKDRGTILNEKLGWDPERVYNKPWLKAVPQRYVETPGSRQKPQILAGTESSTLKPGLMPDLDMKQFSRIKMSSFDTTTTTEADIKALFPKAIKIELKKDEGFAIISFANPEFASYARKSKDGVSFKGKQIILESVQ